jgi:Domain of unknown function (DUF4111)/Nucleotidyltransferase domain
MMSAPLHPTPYADVNTVLHDLLARIRLILGERFRGMYLDGSLALGDFDPHSSDIDFVVTTDNTQLSDALFLALRDMHARFDASGSPWATEVEAVYIPQDSLRRDNPVPPWVPRNERGGTLVKEHLDGSWIIHWYILREHGVVVAGPDPRPLIDPIEPQDLRRAMAALAESWLEPARHDRLRLQHRGFQIYTVRTLCRMLYTLDSGAVVSKPVAARWAQATLGVRWAALIERAVAWRKDPSCQETPSDEEISETLALIEYTLERCRQLDCFPSPTR